MFLLSDMMCERCLNFVVKCFIDNPGRPIPQIDRTLLNVYTVNRTIHIMLPYYSVFVFVSEVT